MLVDLPYDIVAETRETLTTTLQKGNSTQDSTEMTLTQGLRDLDWVEVSFDAMDILCLETLRLSDSNDPSFAMEIIQDYDPHAWNVNTEQQSWESATGREITYYTNDCTEDWRMLSKASKGF